MLIKSGSLPNVVDSNRVRGIKNGSRLRIRRLRLVPMTGLEPVWGCPRGILSPLRLPFRHIGKRKEGSWVRTFCLEAPPRFELGVKLLQSSALPLGYGAEFGAGDGTRTRGLRLGKATLYQLSHSRIFEWCG